MNLFEGNGLHLKNILLFCTWVYNACWKEVNLTIRKNVSKTKKLQMNQTDI